MSAGLTVVTCLCLQHKALSPPQRAASNAETKVSRRAGGAAAGTPPSCPMHGLRSDLLKELEAKTGPGKFPLLTALCSDASLHGRCTCHAASPAVSDVRALQQPGTVSRPLSWHSEYFALDSHVLPAPALSAGPPLRVFNAPSSMTSRANAAAGQYTPRQNNMSGSSSWSDPNSRLRQSHDSSWSDPNSRLRQSHDSSWSDPNSRLRQSHDSLDIGLDYPTMLTHPNGHLPAYIAPSGLTGTHSLDDLLKPHHYALGLAS